MKSTGRSEAFQSMIKFFLNDLVCGEFLAQRHLFLENKCWYKQNVKRPLKHRPRCQLHKGWINTFISSCDPPLPNGGKGAQTEKRYEIWSTWQNQKRLRNHNFTQHNLGDFWLNVILWKISINESEWYFTKYAHSFFHLILSVVSQMITIMTALFRKFVPNILCGYIPRYSMAP